MTRLYAGEPAAGPWRAVPVTEVLSLLGRPRILAVDGRSGGVPHDPRSELVVATRPVR